MRRIMVSRPTPAIFVPRGPQGLRGPQGAPGQPGEPGQPGAPATSLFVAVEGNGDTPVHEGLEEVIHDPGTGVYEVFFDRNVEACVPIATLSHDDPGVIQATTLGGANDSVRVHTADADGAAGPSGFNLAVLC